MHYADKIKAPNLNRLKSINIHSSILNIQLTGPTKRLRAQGSSRSTLVKNC
jgi:hypothetical protein